jgi:2,3-bisphosphoglycerate-independent phosphoglycerate mutase
MIFLGLSKRNKKFYQGFYKPKSPEKYIGKLDNIIYRSGLELKFFRWADNSSNVLEWASEEIKIPYYDPATKKNRNYFVDAYVKIKEGEIIKKYIVEIKPWKQTQEPKATKGKKRSNLLYEQVQWVTNSKGKWPAAKQFAKKHGMEFIIITEKELN